MFSKYLNLATKIAGYTFAVSCMAASLTFAYTMLAPIDILKDWTLTSTKNTYATGEEAVIRSSLVKVMDTSEHPGKSERWLVCGTQKYPINEAIAASHPGTKITDLHMNIPENLPQLPQTCHINITIHYFVYGYRPFEEAQNSDDFTVVKGD